MSVHSLSEMMQLTVIRIIIIAFLFPCYGLSQSHSPKGATNVSDGPGGPKPYMKECLDATKRALGEQAKVLKCGKLNDPNIVEVVGAIRKRPYREGVSDIFVSRLVILRHEASGWSTALTVSRQIRNKVGYVGIEYIDDWAPFWGYSVQFYDHRVDGEKAFSLSLKYMSSGTDTEEIPADLSWNAVADRYQEFTMNTAPVGFKPELKNPPHR